MFKNLQNLILPTNISQAFDEAQNFSIPNGTQFPMEYDMIKDFISVPYTISSANGVTSYDDPTYLGFSIEFDQYSPLFSGAKSEFITADFNIANAIDEINFTGPFSTDDGFSALSYLKNIGETKRAYFLEAFTNGLFDVNTNRPWYWQTITGLDEAWNKSVSFAYDEHDPFIGVPAGEGITIGCLEAIDLKISALFSMYKNAVYDQTYRRFLIPKNLLRFNVKVHITEIRKFKNVVNATKTIEPAISNTPNGNNIQPKFTDKQAAASKFINDNTSKITLVFKNCLFDPRESGKIFENVTNAGGAVMSTTGIKWSYSNVAIDYEFSGLDVVIKEGTNTDKQFKNIDVKPGTTDLTFLQKLTSNAQRFADSQLELLKDSADRQATTAARTGLLKARGILDSLLFGNVHGFRNRVLQGLQNPSLLVNTLLGVGNRIGNENLTSNGLSAPLNGNIYGDTSNRSVGDFKSTKILDDGNQPTNNDGLLPPTIPGNQNIYGSRPSGPSLNSSNIYG